MMAMQYHLFIEKRFKPLTINKTSVRFCGDYRIKPHIPLLEINPANCFKFQSCDFTTQVEFYC